MYAKARHHVFALYERGINRLNTGLDIMPDLNGRPVAKVLHHKNDDEIDFNSLLEKIGVEKDKSSFVTLYDYFAPRVKSFLMKAGISMDMADELAQETLLAVWRKAHTFNPKKASASTWIFTIARNKRIDFLRKEMRPSPDMTDPVFDYGAEKAPDEGVEDMVAQESLLKAIEELPEEQADLVRKSFFEDKTHSVIAEETNLPLGTVKSRIRLALERLRYHLGGKEL